MACSFVSIQLGEPFAKRSDSKDRGPFRILLGIQQEFCNQLFRRKEIYGGAAEDSEKIALFGVLVQGLPLPVQCVFFDSNFGEF